MFKNIFDNIIICINENITQNKIYDQIKNIPNYTINCSEKCELEKCGLCSPSSSKMDLCIECNVKHGYYPMENDSSNIREYINCYKGINGYYLDKNESIYKKCFYTCETCEINGDDNSHNCLKCNESYIYELNYSNSNYKNCYDNIYSTNIYSTNINSITQLQLNIPDDITSILDTKESTYNLINNISETQKRIQIDSNDEIIYEYILEDPWNTIFYFPNITNNTEIFNTIKNNIISLYNRKNGKSQICIGNENIIFQITNSKNELELLNGDFVNNRNISILDLGKCETILKEKYNINEKDSLIFIKRENTNLKASEKNIQYLVYHPYNFSKLNLSYCDENTINLYVKTELSGETYEIYKDLKSLGYNMFDIMDPFYQDICTPYQYLNQTDIILSDRINYIYNNKDSQCQPNCQFSSYLSNSLYLNCTCEVIMEEEVNNKFSGKKVYESFYDVLKYSNYKIMKCYKLVFNMTSLTKNLGSIFIIILFLIYLLCLITYMIKGIKPLNSIIEKEKNIKISTINIFKINKKIHNKIPNKISNKIPRTIPKKFHKKIPKRKNSVTNPPNKKVKEIKIKNKRDSKKSLTHKNSSIKNIFGNKNISSFDELKENKDKTKKPKKLDAFELRELKFEDAIIKDKRSFRRIYLDILFREHKILFTFLTCNDYNLFYIKLARFIFQVATDTAINIFFFSDNSMHKIFLNYGKYDFFQQIPQIIYTTIISQLIDILLCYLSLTDKHIYEIKKLNSTYKEKEKLKCIKIKLFSFFFFTFIVFGFFWYIVAVFCAVYKETQRIFLKDSLFSFLSGLLYPFVLYLFPSALRKLSFKLGIKYIYTLSDIIPIF